MIARIHTMRALGRLHQLSALSIPEVRDPLAFLTLVYARDRKFRGNALKTGPLINAILLQFLSLPEPDRQRFAFEGLAGLEALLDEEPADESAPAPVPTEAAEVTDESPPKRAKRRSG